MFLIQSLLVFAAVYWICALLAEFILTSPEERALPEPVRAGIAFLFSTTYFAAAWQLVSIDQAWALGAGLLAMYVVATAPSDWRTESGRRLRAFLSANGKGFAACLAGALILFVPLMIANKYGPFTEGGGDVSIYADTTHYLTQHGLTVKGAPSTSLDHTTANLRDSIDTTIDRHVLNRYAEQRYMAADRQRINPPSTDNAVYRLLVLQSMSFFLYPPYGQFYFLAGSTNYHVYYGVQAFIYGVLLAGAWYVFRRFPRRAALMYAGLVGASHAIVSIFYNTYSAQTIALLVAVLVLALLPSMRFFSWPGLRTYVIPTVYIWISYVHFLSLIVPLLFVAGLRSLPAWRGAAAPPSAPSKPPVAPSRRALRWIVLGVFTFLVGLLVLSGAQKSILLVRDLTVGLLSGEKNIYMGDRIQPFSLRWLSFMFGFVSQQHLQPFAVEIAWVLKAIYLGVALGVASFVMGLVVIGKIVLLPSSREAPERKLRIVVYCVLLVTIALHVYVSQAYVYTQAKGAQNVLLLLYAALVLPFALGLWLRKDAAFDRLISILGITLLAFAATLAIPRAVYAVKLAQAKDRATILEPSYFAEARKIHAQDDNPFVLFEPRKSGDLYMSIQPFSGARMVPTRHLALTRMNFETRPPVGEKIDASWLIASPRDLQNLWTLSARKGESGAMDIWTAVRVADGKTPAVYLFADDYEQNFGERPRREGSSETGMFSYVRNGSAMVYLPAGEAASVEVTLTPRDAPMVEAMREEISQRVKKGEFGSVEMAHAGAFVTLTRQFPKREAPVMVAIARFSGEHWVNVRVSGKELAPTLAAPTTSPGTVSGVLRKEPSGKWAVEVSWAGIAAPHKEDWVGVFPVGGNDQSRVAFGFLEGQKEGTFKLEVPGPASAQYEVRLFKPGSWNAIATHPVKAETAPAR